MESQSLSGSTQEKRTWAAIFCGKQTMVSGLQALRQRLTWFSEADMELVLGAGKG
jgi:hypothetical protein